MNLQFSIAKWAAWAPGLSDQAAWLAHFAKQNSAWDHAEAVAPVPELAPMTRRRLNRIGRSALQVAYAAHTNFLPCPVPPCPVTSSTGLPYPVIFASRYGDLARSVVLLSAVANHETVSPTAFSVSVHNAIGAIFSIERGDTENYSALAAGADTVPCAFVEAVALLADGAKSVLLVVYEDPLPDVYANFADAPQFPHAWACSIVPANADLGIISLNRAATKSETIADLPIDIAVLRFLISGLESLDAAGWCYTRA